MMSFNINNAYNFLNNVFKIDDNYKSSINKLINYCRDSYKSNCWDEIERIDFEKDMLNLQCWVKKYIENITNGESIDTLWFGLFEHIVNENEIYQMYITTAQKYDEDDYETLEIEDEGYFDSKILYDISIILRNQPDIKEIGEYVLVLGYSCIIIKEIIKLEEFTQLLRENNINEVVVGFDSGDYIVLVNNSN